MALVPWTMGLAPRAATRRVLAPDRALATLLAETLSTVPSATIGARLELLAALDLQVSLSVPVLAIEARHDWLVPRSVTRALAADLRAPLVTIDGPHLVLQRSPAAVASAIETFLESH